MNNKKIILAMAVFLGLVFTNLWADTYTGSIKFGDGLDAVGPWNSAELSWTANNETHPGLWTYVYSFSVDRKAISHMIIGSAESLGSQNILGGTSAGFELGQFGQNDNSTPGMPEEMYGLKWNVAGNSLVCTRTVVSDRPPMWGDFYAKSGKDGGDWAFACNTGFGSIPSDLAPGDGNNGGWVLVPGMTYPEQVVSNFARDSFEEIRDIIAPEDESLPKVAFIGNHVEVSSRHWVFVLDSTGHRIFRPLVTYPHIKHAFDTDIGPFLGEWLETPVPQATLEEAKILAMTTLGANYMRYLVANVIARRELMASKPLDGSMLKHHEGRTVVLFNPPVPLEDYVESYRTTFTLGPDGNPLVTVEPISVPPSSYETSITFAPGGRAIRVESDFLTPDVREVLDVYHEGLTTGMIPGRAYYQDNNFRFGTFFSHEEFRFEITAYSWEGEKFLNTDDPYCIPEYTEECNPYWPFYPWDWCYNAFWAPDVDRFIRQTRSYKYYVWDWWNLNGRKNGIRGNWDDNTQSWDHNDVKVILHKDLRSYSVVEPVTETKNITTCDGIDLTVPRSVGNKMEDKFFQDLERCHAAFFNTHGGTCPFHRVTGPERVYQIKRNGDIWIPLHEEGDPGLGSGNLRHLFLETCSSMNWIYGPSKGGYRNLESDWMNGHVADGIRTICGHDGDGAGADRSGWRFFGYYHLGDSISQSWFNEMLKENPCQHPVVIAYGSTLDEAAETLYDGRLSKERGGKGWVIAVETWIVNPPEGLCEEE
jgi:hypothetical protein